jgi:hypothetical protein
MATAARLIGAALTYKPISGKTIIPTGRAVNGFFFVIFFTNRVDLDWPGCLYLFELEQGDFVPSGDRFGLPGPVSQALESER